MQASRHLGRQVIRRFGARNAHAGGDNQTTFNDLPQPQGSFRTVDGAKQRKYTAHLIIGVSTLVGTIVFGKATGLLNTYNEIPNEPAKIDSYK